MMSGQLDIFTAGEQNPHLHVLYYDSCSKYLQLGQDIAMGGLVVVPVELQNHFERLRRNTGTILYNSAAHVFPQYDRATHMKRMHRFSRNAQVISHELNQDPELNQHVKAVHPLVESHPDRALAQEFDSVRGIVTFEFTNPSFQHRDALNAYIEMVLKLAKERGVALTKGVSFGFSLPRISAAAAMAENSPPFLRLSVGDRSYEETLAVAGVLREAFQAFFASHQRLNSTMEPG